MCDKCEPVYQAFINSKKEEQRTAKEFYEVIDLVLEYIHKDVLELYAGDGPLETIREYFDTSKESAFVMHYIRCKNCGGFYLTGRYVYGEPLIKVLSGPLEEFRLKALWGREGVYFSE